MPPFRQRHTRAPKGASASTAQLRKLFDTLPDGVVFQDASGRIVAANDSACRILGLTLDEMMGRTSGDPRWMAIRPDGSPFPGEEHPSMVALRTGQPVAEALMGLKNVSSDEVRWIRVDAVPEPGARAGAPGGVYTVFRDVTDRLRAEEALRRSEARLRSYFESPLVGIAVTSPDKGWVEVNETFCRMLGYTREELTGRTWADLTHPDDLSADEALFRRVLAGEIPGYSLEKRYLRKDGTPVWASLSVSCVRRPSGEIEHFVALVEDVSARRAAEERLARSEERFRNLAELAPVGIFLADPEGRNTYVNAASERILAMTGPGASGLGWAGAVHPEDRERALSEWQRTVRQRSPLESEYRILHPDGQVRAVRVLGATVRDAHQEVTGFIGVLVDLTDILRLRDQVALSSRLAAIGTLVAGVAHEVNNPLAAALASEGHAREIVVELRDAVRSGHPPAGEAVARDLEAIEEALDDAIQGDKRVASIVRDLTLFARPELDRASVSLAGVVEKAMRWLPGSVQARADVVVEARDVGEVLASEGQLSQVVVNLVNNAARAIPAGRRGRIVVRVGPGGAARACIEVEDDGVGMAPEVLARAFDPFFSTRQPGEGMGLGLALAHSIVQAFGGTITASSTPGRGTTFRIELPLARATPTATAPPAADRADAGPARAGA